MPAPEPRPLTPGEQRAHRYELEDHLNELVMGLGVTIRGVIEREVASSCALNPSEVAEMEQRIDELSEWPREQGVDSPLWC
jgi:hypothetical protein